MTLAAAYGVFFSFPVFFVPLLEEFRWSRGLTAGAMSVSTIVQGLLSPVVGTLIDRLGARPLIVTGVLLLAGSALLTATVQAPWQLYLYTGVLGAVGLVGLGWVPMSVLLARRVTRRRGRMVGLAFSGMGVGIFAMGPLVQWLIARVGWRLASAAVGVGILVALLPITWLGLRGNGAAPGAGEAPRPGSRGLDRAGGGGEPPPPPSATTPDPTLGDALRSGGFWALFAAYFFTPLAVMPVFTHQVAFAVDQGFAPLFAASVLGVVGLMSSMGRVLFGLTTDRLGGPAAAALSFACTGGGALLLLALEGAPRPAGLVVYALVFGLGFGARGPIVTAMATERFGGRSFGTIYGVLNLANGLGAALGPWFGGAVHDVTGSYRAAFLSSVVFSVAGATCFGLAGRLGRPRGVALTRRKPGC